MPFNCADLESIEKGCESAIGGLNQILYINDSENVGFDDFVLDAATHTYTTLALAADPGTPFESIEFRKNIGSLSEAYSSSPDGSVLITQTLTLALHGRDASKSRKISLIAAGQRNVDIIILQNDGAYVYLREAQLTAIADGTGTAKTEGSKYSLTFTAEQEELAYFVSSAAIAAVL